MPNFSSLAGLEVVEKFVVVGGWVCGRGWLGVWGGWGGVGGWNT